MAFLFKITTEQRGLDRQKYVCNDKWIVMLHLSQRQRATTFHSLLKQFGFFREKRWQQLLLVNTTFNNKIDIEVMIKHQ